jgi:2-haloacid dehalogenase
LGYRRTKELDVSKASKSSASEHMQLEDGAARLPLLLVFDVNETLSDMAPLVARFEEVGAPGRLAGLWFAGLLRDGFALTVGGENPPFANLAAEGLRTHLSGESLDRGVEEAAEHVMAGFSELHVHHDVPEGLLRLADLGIRLVTLTNGSTTIAERLLSEAGVEHCFESFLSVEQARVWKPAPGAYAYALEHCGVEAADAMLVAAHPWDTDGARRVGLTSAWVNRAGGPYPAYFLTPNLDVVSLLDLAQQLGERRGLRPEEAG